MKLAGITSAVLASLCATVAAFTLVTAPVQAEDVHHYLSQFSEVPAVGPHGEAVPLPGPLSLTRGNAITVDSGEVYVAEGEVESRIDKFDASNGAFLSQFPQVPSLVYLDQGVAVGHAGGETHVYVGADEELAEGARGAVAVFDANGALQRIWTGVGTPSKERFDCFECTHSGDVAVDDSGVGWAAGDVYVADPQHGVVDVYEPETGSGEKLVTQIPGTSPSEPFNEPYRVSVTENGDVLVADRPLGSTTSKVDIFKPAALAGQYEFLGTLALPPNLSIGTIYDIAANDGEGDIYLVGNEAAENGAPIPDQVFEFDAAGQFVGRIRPSDAPGGAFAGNGVVTQELSYPAGVAADPVTHDVYVSTANARNERPNPVFVFGPNVVLPDVASGPASHIGSTSATLNGTVDLEGAGAANCQFDWGTSSSYGEVAPCSTRIEGPGEVPVSVALTGLQPDTTYHYRLQATNANGTSEGLSAQDVEFTTTGPGLRNASASDVASTSATLQATIDPDGAPTSYYFQYGKYYSGKSVAYESTSPAAPGTAIGSGEADLEVARHLQGLTSATAYHYRVVAVSELEVEPGVVKPVTFPGPDHIFTTQPLGGALTLPDGRHWELVSPPDKRGSRLGEIQSGATQASRNGEMMTDFATVPTEAGVPGYVFREVQMLATRGATGWSSQDIAVPHAAPTGAVAGFPDEALMFSEDLSLAIVEPHGEFTSLGSESSPPDTERTPYLRHDLTCATTPTGCYEPLATAAPGFADVPPGTHFEGEPTKLTGDVRVIGATPDLSHVIAESAGNVSLTPTPGTEGALYEWSADAAPSERLQPVSVLPENEGAALVWGRLGSDNLSGRHAIARDGSRIVWEPYETGLRRLFLRDMSTGKTIRLDAAQGGSAEGYSQAVFQFANSNDSKVFFTDAQRLTTDSGASEGSGPDLYECEIVEEAGHLRCALHDLTPLVAGRPADVRGELLGGSEDGSVLYFVATGVLTAAESSRGEKAVRGADNLYRLHYDSAAARWEAPQLVAVLSSEDYPAWSEMLRGQPTRVTPDGNFLAFMSNRSLTGYDNRDANSGRPDEEVFLFDASADRLVCTSCNPTGARPAGVENEPTGKSRLVGGLNVWSSSAWLAANIPGWTPFKLESAQYQSRYLSSEGRLFFNSSDALVPQDINGNEDVYEYEPDGVGGCSGASATYSEASDGCVGLISSGTSPDESAFLDASETGNDVFFLTTEQLVPQDIDTAYDVYDAHVCTDQSPCFAAPASSPACTTADACRAAPEPQPASFGAPSSATFSGAGNITPAPSVAKTVRSLTRAQRLARALAACRKQRARHRASCERSAHKRYRAKRPHKASGAKRPRKASSTKGSRG